MRKGLKLLLCSMILSFSSMSAMASESNLSDPNNPQERVEQLEDRVHEIWRMDFSEMDNVEKAALKQELKQIKKELKSTKGLDDKVSISIGAIIIILLLIIIIT